MNRDALESAKKLFFILLGIDIAITVMVGFNAFSTIGTLKNIQSGVQAVDQSLLRSFEFWDGFSKLLFLTTIGVGFGLVKWLNSCYRFAKDSIGATGFKNESWTVAGWIIPIFNFFKPYQIVNEIYRAGEPTYTASDGWKKESGSGLLLTWWIFWAVTHFIGFMASKQLLRAAMRDDVTLQQAIGLTELHAWFCVVSVVVAGAWLMVAAHLTKRLLDRAPISGRVEVIPDQTARTESETVGSAAWLVQRPIHTTDGPATRTRQTHSHTEKPINVKNPPDKFAASQLPVTERPQVSEPTASDPTLLEIDEDGIYDSIGQELENGKPDRATWTKAFAEANGDEKQAKAAYIRLRFEKLLTQERNLMEARQAEIENLARHAEEARKAAIEEQAKKIEGLRSKFLSGSKLDEAEIQELVLAITNDPEFSQIAEPFRGNTLLHLAAEAGLTLAGERLIRLGASATAKNGNGKIPLDVCKSFKLATILSDAATTEGKRSGATASQEEKASLGNSLRGVRFRAAVQTGEIAEIVGLLGDQPRLANIIDSEGNTPLMLAADEGHFEIVNLLLASGADVDAVNQYGQTARAIASKNRRPAIALAIDDHKHKKSDVKKPSTT